MRRARVRRPRMRVRRLSDLSVNRMVPNVLTLLALCAGMTAMRLAMGGNFEGAVFAIIAAGIFGGAPAPAGAGLVMIPMFLTFEWGDWLFRSPYLNAVTITGIALLMVSKVPTVSLKRIRVPHHMVVPTLLAFVVATAFLTT